MNKKINYHQLKKRFFIISSILIILLIVMNQLASSITLISYIRLKTNGADIVATVIDSTARETKISMNNNNNGLNNAEVTVKYDYLIKYRFSLADSNELFETNEWLGIKESQWRNSVERNSIDILYDIDNPKINSPKVNVQGYLYDLITKLIISIVSSLGFAFVIVFIMYADLKSRGLYSSQNKEE